MSFGRRLQWARNWVYGNTPTAKANSEPDLADYQIVDHDDTLSNDGVRSLPETYTTTNASHSTLVQSFWNDIELPGIDPISFFDISSAIPRKDSLALERAGRHSNQHAFRDLRSGAKVRMRSRKQSQKYYGYRYVKPGDLGTEYSEKTNTWGVKTAQLCHPLPDTLPIIATTKKELYELAQWTRPPTYHRRKLEKEYNPWSLRYSKRVAAKKHSHQVMGDAINEAMLLASDQEHWETCSVCAWPFASSQDLPSHVPDECDEEPDRERQKFTLGQLLDREEGV